ncbi:carbohydrate sulfotransferase 6-like [Penaeus japonicus]|uniref:carbohydrate sulfotransferase 6-like n=1 Tax=Penaeus japonicus TaxID=27405 RepID=UPI001C715F91|nr:carbohydrate sulfotransferase 6-like [Penaeus japonicus]XP_042873362.1 carbohydrate sulfotransferase 6-like [Penaeus japonicus]
MRVRHLRAPLFAALFLLLLVLGRHRLPTARESHASDTRDPGEYLGREESDNEREGSEEGKGEEAERRGEDRRRMEGSGKRQKQVVLWTGWRSGSSFLGKVLTRALDATFYSYEPLHMYGVKVMHDDDDAITRKAQTLLKDLILCRLERHPKHGYYLHQNEFLFDSCRREKSVRSASLCRNTSYVSGVCRSADMNVIKVLRLSLKFARPLLRDDDLDVQVIYLVRDPRAVLSSRSTKPWCQMSCRDPETICSLLEEDLKQASLLSKEYPTRFKMVLYDEVCDDGSTALLDVMAFLGLPVTEKQERLLPSRRDLSEAEGNVSRAEVWRVKASFGQIVQPIQRLCHSSLERLGLRVFASKEELRDLSRPVLLRPPGI